MRRHRRPASQALLPLPPLLLLLLPLPASSKCANDCNGNGFCRANGTSNSVCECNSFSTDNVFNAVDCSFKACPTGKAWVDYASANDVAHAAGTTCSNKGHCQRSLGICACESGFTGLACQRTHCPGNPNKNSTVCSGHGVCLSMGEMAADSRYKDGVRLVQPVTTYTLWDHDMIYGCVCEPGYSGYDCGAATRACPSGDDPLTPGVNAVQILECTCLTACSGGFHLSFKGVDSALIPHDATMARLKHALEAMETVRGVSLVLHGGGTSVCSNGGVSTAITFTHNPGSLPALVPTFTSTLQSSTATAPTMSVVTTGAGAQGGTAVTGTREDVECSNRGTCSLDGDTGGYCTCQTGFSSSDGANGAGSLGDCSYMPTSVTSCPLYAGTACGSGASRGTCSGASTYTCTCASGFNGPACEFTDCPTGNAWFDEPTSANMAHAAGAVCSNRGSCDRLTGACTCEAGFEGTACETLSCPGGTPCGGTGRGTCYTIADLATLGLNNGELIGATYSGAQWDR